MTSDQTDRLRHICCKATGLDPSGPIPEVIDNAVREMQAVTDLGDVRKRISDLGEQWASLSPEEQRLVERSGGTIDWPLLNRVMQRLDTSQSGVNGACHALNAWMRWRPSGRGGSGRFGNVQAYAVAGIAARLLKAVTGGDPTYETGTTIYRRMLEALFLELGIAADTKGPGKWAVGKIAARSDFSVPTLGAVTDFSCSASDEVSDFSGSAAAE
jgi:hypothetical protein